MKKITLVLLITLFAAVSGNAGENKKWYTGDQRCPPPKDDGKYSAPYNAFDFPRDYPTFDGADKQGWSCSYQREDGVIVQYGDSRTPQQQWMDVWRGGNGDDK